MSNKKNALSDLLVFVFSSSEADASFHQGAVFPLHLQKMQHHFGVTAQSVSSIEFGNLCK